MYFTNRFARQIVYLLEESSLGGLGSYSQAPLLIIPPLTNCLLSLICTNQAAFYLAGSFELCQQGKVTLIRRSYAALAGRSLLTRNVPSEVHLNIGQIKSIQRHIFQVIRKISIFSLLDLIILSVKSEMTRESQLSDVQNFCAIKNF